MNLEFALVCLTLVAIVAIVYGKDNLARKALDIFSGLVPRLPGLEANQQSDGVEKPDDAAATMQNEKEKE